MDYDTKRGRLTFSGKQVTLSGKKVVGAGERKSEVPGKACFGKVKRWENKGGEVENMDKGRGENPECEKGLVYSSTAEMWKKEEKASTAQSREDREIRGGSEGEGGGESN